MPLFLDQKFIYISQRAMYTMLWNYVWVRSFEDIDEHAVPFVWTLFRRNLHPLGIKIEQIDMTVTYLKWEWSNFVCR